jgi:hypothetical protein
VVVLSTGLLGIDEEKPLPDSLACGRSQKEQEVDDDYP